LSSTDPFIKNHLDISEKASQFPQKQKLRLGIFRNDFMIDQLTNFIYQIEINTIASSMGSHSDNLKKFYSHFSKKYPDLYSNHLNIEDEVPRVPIDKENVIDTIAESMISAIKLFSPENYKSTCIVFVVQKPEFNQFDQIALENILWGTQ
jgi:hypothetical protein